jgi:pPIWI RE three-gene island domain Z
MRDTSTWYADLAKELQADGSLPTERFSPRDFCCLELGLYFLTNYLPGEPVGALWPVLSGYVVGEPPLRPVVRRLRHLMGDIARTGYWRYCLDQYRRVPVELRGFARTDDPRRRISDRSTFKQREPAVCRDRFSAYREALDAPVPYALETIREPAEPGKTYTFKRRDGGEERVRIPDDVEVLPAPPMIQVQAQRRRRAWRIDFATQLQPTAAWIDKELEDKPEVTNRDFVARLQKMVVCGVDQASGALVEDPGFLSVDGVEHIVGLANSGKSTLVDVVTVERVREGFHVTLVLGSVTDVYGKVSFLRSLGIRAVPLVGKHSRTEHAGRYWRSTLASSPTVFPAVRDPAARFVNTVCLLDPYREGNQAAWSPLTPEDFPCRGQLRPDGEQRSHRCDCPLLAVCPYQETERQVADAEVWVTTPAGLVASRAEPSEAAMRWLEACQHHTDLIIVDEADTVQQDLDQRFLQAETLVAPNEGWADRTSRSKLTGFDRDQRRQLRNANVKRFNQFDQVHQPAIDKLYELVLSEDNQVLVDVIGKAPFSGYSLLFQVARIMHGLPLRRVDDDKGAEEAAEDFFHQHLERLEAEPFEPAPDEFAKVVVELTAEFPDSDRTNDALDRWLLGHAPDGQRPHVQEQLGLLRLLFQAGFWSSRITTSFFEMSTLYPAVAEALSLGDPDSFWQQQPPRDYQPLVPEAPMGNLLALQWLPNRRGDSGALRVVWVRGVGRWLLHHLHDLLEPEGIQGPHAILTSATSWVPGSSIYHLPIPPTAVLREPPEDRKALAKSTLAYRPVHRADTTPVLVSGRQGPARRDALREVAAGICRPRPGAARSLLEETRDLLDEGRKQVLFVVLSGAEAALVTDYVNNKTGYRARNVTPDAADPGQYGLHRRMIVTFPDLGDDIMVAAEMAIQRSYNILNRNKTAALGAVFYLTRPHPPPTDPTFPLSLINQRAMTALLHPAHVRTSGLALGRGSGVG